jgi:hypothetical protein
MDTPATQPTPGSRQLGRLTSAIILTLGVGFIVATAVLGNGAAEPSASAVGQPAILDLPPSLDIPAIEAPAQAQDDPTAPLAPRASGRRAMPESHRHFQFLEWNLYLPGTPDRSTTNWVFIEENRWGEHFVFAPASPSFYPSPDTVPQRRPGVGLY